jgi:iduronate 2-sulfatase
VGLTGTHPGFQHTPEFRKLYPTDKITWEKEPPDIRANVPPVAFEGYLTSKFLDEERRKHIASYYAAISTLDAQVGAIIAALEKNGLVENTIIVFTSDHGRHLGEHGGIYDKRSLFEESVRVPLIVAAPGKKSNAVSPRLVEMIDLYPTLAELCGLTRPNHLEGTSFVPLLDMPDRPWKKAAFSESGVSGKTGRSLRTERFRYTEWDAKNGQLYDHQTDPREHVNLYAHPSHANVLAEMRQLLQAGWKGSIPK